MARIRTLKPSFWGDEKVAELSRDARLLFIGLVSMADDEGRFLASDASILGYIYPHDRDVGPAKLHKWLGEIQQQGMVTIYNGGRITYGSIPGFRTHQRISHPRDSTFPPPTSAERLRT